MTNQVVNKIEDVFQAASSDVTLTDDHFLENCNYTEVKKFETNELTKNRQPKYSW